LFFVGHAEREGLARRPRLAGDDGAQRASAQRAGGAAGGVVLADGSGCTSRREASPPVGHWDDVEWLPCRDGKYRPAQPGVFPLADGVPARTSKLRGIGNAIVPQVAAAFVRAVM
jgi:DNA (cytosine-5)-methyltransferase 1